MVFQAFGVPVFLGDPMSMVLLEFLDDHELRVNMAFTVFVVAPESYSSLTLQAIVIVHLP